MDDEKPRLVADPAPRISHAAQSRLLTVAPTIPDAFQLMYIFEAACTIQVRAQAGGELIPIPQAIIDNAAAQSRQVTRAGRAVVVAWRIAAVAAPLSGIRQLATSVRQVERTLHGLPSIKTDTDQEDAGVRTQSVGRNCSRARDR